MRSLGEVAVFASKDTEVWRVVSKEAELAVSLPTTVTEISVTLWTGHVVTPFGSLDVDLDEQKERKNIIFPPFLSTGKRALPRAVHLPEEKKVQATPCKVSTCIN